MRILALCLIALLALSACGGEGEGGADGDGPGHADGSEGTPFVSSGVSREAFDGVAESLSIMPEESFAGRLHDTEVAAVFDDAMDAFVGRLRNEAGEAVCDVRVAVVLDGDAGNAVEATFEGLVVQGRDTFDLPVAGMAFSDWTVQVETFDCASAPAGMASGEGSEGGGEGGAEGSGEHGAGGAGGGGEGSEGGHAEGGEGGSEGGGGDSEEMSPTTPVTQPLTRTLGDQAASFYLDPETGLFVGTVENISDTNVVCGSKTEIHVGVAGSVVELGPTIPEDLAPGDVLDVVMLLHPFPVGEMLTYELHPESSACP